MTFDPGNLSHINVLDPQKGTYFLVPAVDQAYAKGLSLWQNRVIRRYSRLELKGRTDLVALAEAKAAIRALVDRDLNRKSIHSRKRHARFTEGQMKNSPSERVVDLPFASPPVVPLEADDRALPVFEADLDLPLRSTNAPGKCVPQPEQANQ